MADNRKSSGSGSHEEERNPMKWITYKRKSKKMSIASQEDTDGMTRGSDEDKGKKTPYISMDDDGLKTEDEEDSMTKQILAGESMASLTLLKKDENEDAWLSDVQRQKRTRKRMMKLSDIYERESLDLSIEKMEGVLKISEKGEGEETIGSFSEKEGSRTEELLEENESQNSEEEEEGKESESELPASSPEAEEKPEPLRLFSTRLTVDDTTKKLHISREQMEHFPFSLNLTAEFLEPGRTAALQIIDEDGQNRKMKLISYMDANEIRRYCITDGWKEFVMAHNLEAGDEIIFYQSPTSKDNKELLIEFIKAEFLQ